MEGEASREDGVMAGTQGGISFSRVSYHGTHPRLKRYIAGSVVFDDYGIHLYNLRHKPRLALPWRTVIGIDICDELVRYPSARRWVPVAAALVLEGPWGVLPGFSGFGMFRSIRRSVTIGRGFKRMVGGGDTFSHQMVGDEGRRHAYLRARVDGGIVDLKIRRTHPAAVLARLHPLLESQGLVGGSTQTYLPDVYESISSVTSRPVEPAVPTHAFTYRRTTYSGDHPACKDKVRGSTRFDHHGVWVLDRGQKIRLNIPWRSVWSCEIKDDVVNSGSILGWLVESWLWGSWLALLFPGWEGGLANAGGHADCLVTLRMREGSATIRIPRTWSHDVSVALGSLGVYGADEKHPLNFG